MDKRELEDAFEGFEDCHGPRAGGGGVGGYVRRGVLGGSGGGGLFSVRLGGEVSVGVALGMNGRERKGVEVACAGTIEG